MTLTEDMKDLLALLERHGVAYAVIGGFAVNYYGYPRLTQDFDILVVPNDDNARRALAALDEFGFGRVGLRADFLAREGAALHMGVEPNRIDLLTSVLGVAPVEVVRRARFVDVDGVRLRLISRDDLIASKRASKRARDLADAEELSALEKAP
ncbi:MAG: nucleotidyltransferase [Proteobacteria bacterium]|nr:nucleotidyltransferase [Pseudomonadota bacterium]